MQNFNFHQHTYRCKHADFEMTDEEYIQEYLKMSFKKMAFTDHCPEKEKIDFRTDMRMDYEKRDEYLESIQNLKEKYKEKIEILSGYEIEFLPGQEDNLLELKNETDIVILGQHFIYDIDGKSLKIIKNTIFYDERDLEIYASYIENACSLKIPNIIAHPDLFMKSRNSFEEKDFEISKRICEASLKYDIPLEINLNNIFRTVFFEKSSKTIRNLSEKEQYDKLQDVAYPNKEFWKIASEYNVKVLYGIDTHFRNQILLYNDLVKLANKIIGEDVIKKLNFI